MNDTVTLSERLRTAQARAALADHITRQRWYGGRGRAVIDARIVDVVTVNERDPSVEIALVELRHDDGEHELYHLPLNVASHGDEDGGAVGDLDDVVLPADGAEGVGEVRDAMGDAASVRALWRAIAGGEHRRGDAGEVVFSALAGTLPADDDGGTEVTVRPLGKEQSNSAAVLGDRAMLKCFRRVQLGVSPELEMTTALAQAGFEHVPTPLGAIEYVAGSGGQDARMLLALVQPFLHNGTEGLALALTSLRDLYADAEEAPSSDSAAMLRAPLEQGGSFVPEATRIGEVTAEMHLALLTATSDAMRPRRVEHAQLERWAAEFTDELDRLLGSAAPALDPLRDHRPGLAADLAALSELGEGGMAIRVHGDLHLAQLLRTDAGYTILDFEGEPARSIEERRQHSSSLNDVAGLLRSLDYAAALALADRMPPSDPQWKTMLAHGDAWSQVNRKALWNAYTARVAGSGLLPDADAAGVLRRAFEVRKAIYEVRYELGHRPDWVDIPLRFLLARGGRA